MAQDLTGQFKAWLKTKPADEAYPYASRTRCACAQFARDAGLSYEEWRDGLDFPLSSELQAKPRTFGALLDRLNQSV